MKKIFFVTPIGEENSEERRTADFVLRTFLKPVSLELGYEVVRADIIQTVSNISESIIEQLNSSDLVIADISNANPNVMFELGYRFALKKPYLILTQNVHGTPFDIRDIRAIEYTVTAPNIEDFNQRLSQMIRVIEDSKTQLTDPLTARGEQMAVDLVAGAIQSGDFSSIQNFLNLASQLGLNLNEDDK